MIVLANSPRETAISNKTRPSRIRILKLSTRVNQSSFSEVNQRLEQKHELRLP
jgi:hypothetical protein